jgi:hypothetical protein
LLEIEGIGFENSITDKWRKLSERRSGKVIFEREGT